MYIYIIKNAVNNKCYIGKTVTKSLNSYLKSKFNDAKKYTNRSSRLNLAIRKYGESSFSIHPLVAGLKSNEELCKWEKVFIHLFGTQGEDGYNICDGGEGFTGSHTQEAKNKIRNGLQGIKRSPEFCQGIRERVLAKPQGFIKNNNKPMSEETKKKISQANRGRIRIDIPWNKGLTKEQDSRLKANSGSFSKDRLLSAEIVLKRSSKLKGRKRPDIAERMRLYNPRKKVAI